MDEMIFRRRNEVAVEGTIPARELNGSQTPRSPGARSRRLMSTVALPVLAVSALAVSHAEASVSVIVPCSGSGGGPAGLIAAINAANTAGGGDIILAAGCTYTLTAADHGSDGLPTITTPITIGAAATIARSQSAPAFRIFEVQGGTLTLNSVTLNGGAADSGGALYNDGTVNLNNSKVLNGVATSGIGGGIYNHDSALNVSNSIVSQNVAFGDGGGGIYNDGNGTVTISGSTIAHNRAVHGGGIDNDVLTQGSLTLSSSTLSSNSAVDTGGGLFDVGMGTINSTTISNNTAGAGGGVNVDDGSVTFNSDTITGNHASSAGGGIYNVALIVLNSTSVSHNTPDQCFPAIAGC